ncbi:MAG: AAA family ATPase [Mesorhizobium sp.]|uniref:AAA family ATPase n=1 Tax=unclassified Mesorhizobium TaxID=325217 RepID=UPI000F75D2FF|nr:MULTISPECIES: AAA family ATPase [unclassified Mesorhizobium]RVC81777.1 AAA family ATPase [Mesorhizobium sp. M2A.F.Ca.ET.046.02.1.1]AZO33548.1 AAA family ATPase [Mesorhizobium sp. M2A.F.Ca.ET.046.03.2.1]RWB42762.1 MAG: AAA family ATPase [Mesorhizobium sp.]RWC57910.1 MAG: AAA family ATPase [Mesorhizobium sp.]RWE22020.1 MAG: AAA family ATPase [Mesorhizobium sp.]
MEKLTRKYRPQIYSEVVGQDEAIRHLLPLVRRQEPHHFLFSGGSGTGKTSLALMTARAYRCEGDGGSALPCLECASCKTTGKWQGVEQYSASGLSMPELDEIIEHAPVGGWGRIKFVFIDEAHALREDKQDRLLTVLEKVGSCSFMLATDRPEKLAGRLLDRVKHIQLRPLDAEAGIRHLRGVCAKEGLKYDDEALSLLADLSDGSARKQLQALDDVACVGERITASLVRATLNLDRLKAYVPVLESLLDGDLAKAFAELNGFYETAATQAEALRDLVVQIYENVELRLARPRLGIVGVARATRASIADAIKGIADKKGVEAAHIYYHLSTQLEAEGSARITDSWLRSRLIGLKTFLHSAPPVQQPRQAPSRLPGRALKRAQSRWSADEKAYLPKRKIVSILDAASFLAQTQRRLLNFRLVFFHDELQLDQTQGADLVAACLHELGMRIKSWTRGRDALHYIYLHQVSGKLGFTSTVAGNISEDFTHEVGEWLEGFFRKSSHFRAAPHAVRLKFHRVVDADAKVRQHWRFLRALCRNLDPDVKVDAGRGSEVILDLLKINVRLREPLGTLDVAHPIRMSSSLSATAMRKTPLPALSAARDGAWDRLQSGWELLEHLDRVRELKKFEAETRRINEEFVNDTNLRDHELERLRQGISTDPHDRERTWPIWRTR